VSTSASAASSAIKTAWGQGAIAARLRGHSHLNLAPERHDPHRTPCLLRHGKDGIFLEKFGEISERFRVPVFAIVVQAIGPLCYTLMDLPTALHLRDLHAWIFYGLTVAASFFFARRGLRLLPASHPGYPWVPMIFVIAASGITLSTSCRPAHAAYASD